MPPQKNPHREGFYTIKEAAAYLRVDERTIRNMIKRGQLRIAAIRRPIRIAVEDVEALTTLKC